MSKYSSSQFAAEVRKKFPNEYDSWSDDQITLASVKKDPSYLSWVDFSTLKPEYKDKAVQYLGGTPEIQAALGHFPMMGLQAAQNAPAVYAPSAIPQVVAPRHVSAPAVSTASVQPKLSPVGVVRQDVEQKAWAANRQAGRATPQIAPGATSIAQAYIAIEEGRKAQEAQAQRVLAYELEQAQADYDRRMAVGLIPKVPTPIPLVGEALGITAPAFAEVRPTMTTFAAQKAGRTLTPFQETMGNTSNLLRQGVAPATNLVTGRGEGSVFTGADDYGREGRILQQQIGNFENQNYEDFSQADELDHLRKLQGYGVELSDSEKATLDYADAGHIAGAVQATGDMISGLREDPEVWKDLVEMAGSEAALSVMLAPAAEAGIARVAEAVKSANSARRAYGVYRALSKARTMESIGKMPAGYADALASRFAQAQASKAARTGMVDALAEGDSRLLQQMGVKSEAIRRAGVASAKEAVEEYTTDIPVGTALGYGRGENHMDGGAALDNALQDAPLQGVFGGAAGVAKKIIGDVPHGMSLETAQSAVDAVDARPWVQRAEDPQGVARPAQYVRDENGNPVTEKRTEQFKDGPHEVEYRKFEKAGRSSVPGAEAAAAHPKFRELMAQISKGLDNPELSGQRYRLDAANVGADMGADELAGLGYSADGMGSQSIRGYNVPGKDGGNTAVVLGGGDESTLAHEVIHGVERQVANDRELAAFHGDIEDWKRKITNWGRRNGWNPPTDHKALRAWQSEMFAQTMNTRLGGREDAKFSKVPMSDALVQAFDGHAGAVARNGKLDLRGDVMPSDPIPEQAVGSADIDENDLPFSMAGLKSKSVPEDQLKDYQLMDKKDQEGREEAFRKTGFWKGADGRVRYEIDDSKVSLKPDGVRTAVDAFNGARLSDVIDAPELFSAYPEFKGMKVVGQNLGSAGGRYLANENTIQFSPSEDVRSVLLHEIQHAIQEKEGFAKGGNPFDDSMNDLDHAHNINLENTRKVQAVKSSPEYRSFVDGYMASLPEHERYVIGSRSGSRIDVSERKVADAVLNNGALDIRSVYTVSPERVRAEELGKIRQPLGVTPEGFGSQGSPGARSDVKSPELNAQSGSTFPADENKVPKNQPVVNPPESSDMLYSLRPKDEAQEAQAQIVKHLRKVLNANGIFKPVGDLAGEFGKMPEKAKTDPEAAKAWKSKWDRVKDSIDTFLSENPEIARTAGINPDDGSDDVVFKAGDWVKAMSRRKGADNAGLEMKAMRNPGSLDFEWPESERRQTTIGRELDGKSSGFISIMGNDRMYAKWDPKGLEWTLRDDAKNLTRIGSYDRIWVDKGSRATSDESMSAKPTRDFDKGAGSRWEPVVGWDNPVAQDVRDMQPSRARSDAAKELYGSVPEHLRADFEQYAAARDALTFNDFAKDASTLERMADEERSRQQGKDIGKMTKADALAVISSIERRHDFQKEFQPRYESLRRLRQADIEAQKASMPSDENTPSLAAEKPEGKALVREKRGAESMNDDSFTTQKLTRSAEGGFLTRSERAYTTGVDEAFPMEKVQKLFDRAHGVTEFAESIGARIDQVRGAAGTAAEHAKVTLNPIWGGGKVAVWEDGKQKVVAIPRPSSDVRKALDRYLIAKTAKWRYENDGFTDIENKGDPRYKFSDPYLTEDRAAAWVKSVEGRPDFQDIEKRAKLVWKFHRDLSLMKLDAGHWTPEMYAQITQDPYYIPLIRDVKGAYGSKSPTPGKGQNRFTSTDDLVRGNYKLDRQLQYLMPFVASLMDQEATFVETSKARVARSIVDLAKKDSDKGGSAGLEQLIQPLQPGEDPGLGAMVVPVIDGGEVKMYKVDSELAGYITSMAPYMPSNEATRLMMSTVSLWKGMTTSMNPDFSVANLSRDLQESTFNTVLGGARGLFHFWLSDLPSGFWDAVNDGPLSSRLRASGGSMEASDVRGGHGASVDDVLYGGLWNKAADPLNYVAEKNPAFARALDRFRHVGRTTAGALSHIGEISEMTTRLAMFRVTMENAKKAGKTEAQAEALAVRACRQGTLDFGRMGTGTKALNAYIPFFNAAIQGTDKSVRTVLRTDLAGMGKQRGKAVAMQFAKMAAFGTVPALALVAYNSQFEEYGNIPASERENNWIIMLGGPDYAKIPKAAWQKLTVNVPQAIMERVMGISSPEGNPLYLVAARSLGGAMPVGEASGVLPPLFKTALEEGVNKDFYFRSPIWSDNLDPSMQVSPFTSETMKRIGWGLGVSPARMEHVMRGFLGGNTQNILFLTDLALSGRDDVAFPKNKRIPFLRRFYGQAQEWGGDMERAKKDATKAIRSAMNDGRKELKKQIAAELRKASEMEAQGDKDGARSVRERVRMYAPRHAAYVRELVERRKAVLAGSRANEELLEKLSTEGGE